MLREDLSTLASVTTMSEKAAVLAALPCAYPTELAWMEPTSRPPVWASKVRIDLASPLLPTLGGGPVLLSVPWWMVLPSFPMPRQPKTLSIMPGPPWYSLACG